MFKIVFLTTMYDSNFQWNKAFHIIKEDYNQLFEFSSFSTYYIDTDENILKEAFEKISEADLICYFTNSGINSFKSFPKMMGKFKNKKFFMHSGMEDENNELMKKSNIENLVFMKMLRYFLSDGVNNYINFIKYAANKIGNINIGYKDIILNKWEGIYDGFEIINDTEKYLENISNSSKDIVGILVYSSMYHKNNLKHIDSIIEEIKRQDLIPLCIITHTNKNESIGAKGLQWSFDNLFKYKSKLLPKVIINAMGMSVSILSNPSDGTDAVGKSIFEQLDIPVIQAMTTYQSLEQWEDSIKGLDSMSLTSCVYYPEFEGQIISVTASYAQYESDEFGDRIVNRPINERINKIARLAKNWIKLKNTRPCDKKVAIIFHNMPPRNDMIGCAFGLDTPATVFNIIKSMKNEGVKLDYDFNNPDEIINKIIEGVSNDKKWLNPQKVLEKSIDTVSKEQYENWFETLADKNKQEMIRDWEKPLGEFMVYSNQHPVPGILNGNVFIGLQPSRGFIEKAEESYHSTDLVPSHQYYSFYKWIKEEFKADVIVHVGTHGTLEWLPGKEVGLSNKCYPDIMIDDLPHLYPYSINVIGEGIQVKRRSNGVIISHLISSMMLSEGYDYIADLDNLIKQYYQAKNMENGKISIIRDEIIEKSIEYKFDLDLKIDKIYMENEFKEYINILHAYIEELKGNFIKDGLHIFGECPKEERLNNLIFALLRIDSEVMPSISKSIASIYNLDLEYIKNNGCKMAFDGVTNLMILEDISYLGLEIIQEYSCYNFKVEKIETSLRNAINKHKGCLNNYNPSNFNSIKKLMKYINTVIINKLKDTGNEIYNFNKGARGEFIIPGKGGCPTRGNISILPSGTNFYSVDPNSIPSRASYEVGKSLGDNLINRYLRDEGKYPNSVAIIVYGGETMKTNGDDIAEILYLMGVKPIWLESTDKVIGLEVISLEVLKRPRIDVVSRISGLFRDTFPNLIELLEEAVNLVSQLDEPEEMNFIKANISNDVKILLNEGISLEEARENASLRVFGCPAGTYGAGIDMLIESKNWQTSDDLGQSYINWSAHAYSSKIHGEKLENIFKMRLEKTDLTVKNESSKEIDMLESDDYFNYHGGLASAVKKVKGDYVKSYSADSSDPSKTKIKDVEEETSFIMRSRILNPKWYDGLKKHGYKGAQEISAMMDIAFGWDATTNVIKDWMYDSICDTYVLNKESRDWIESVNKWALNNISERLIEANQRGMWQTDDDRIKELRKIYIQTEGLIEEAY